MTRLKWCGLRASSGERRGGKTIDYSDLLICKLLIALELEESGIDPTLAVRLVTGRVGPGRESDGWKQFLPRVMREARTSSGGDDDVMLMVESYFMSAAWGHPDIRSGKIDPAWLRDKKLGEIKDFWILISAGASPGASPPSSI